MTSKKDMILSSLKIFLQKGYDSTSIEDLISESHISKGGLYYHFKNKEEIFLVAVDYLFSEVEKYQRSLFLESSNIKVMLKTNFDSLSNISKILFNISGSENIRLNNFYLLMIKAFIMFPDIKAKYCKLQKENQKLLIDNMINARQKGEIKDSIDCYTTGFMINLIVKGIMMHYTLMEESDIKEKCEKIFQYIWNGISTEKKQNIY